MNSPVVPSLPVLIAIAVINPVAIAHKLGKHTVYTVKGSDENGSFEVLRRYRHFLALRNHMRVKWPGVLVPGLPPKKILGKMKPSLIDSRCKQLDNFCKSVSEIPYLYLSDEFQVFCRGSRNYEEAKLDFIPPSLSEIRVSYEILFGDMQSDPSTPRLKPADIPPFESKLTSIHQYCLHLRRELKKMKAFSRSFHSEVTRLNTHLQAYFQTTYTANTTTPVHTPLAIAHWPTDRSFVPLVDWVKSEQIAVEYMLDTIRSRDDIRKRMTALTIQLESLESHFSALQTGKKSLSDRISALRSRSSPLEALKADILTTGEHIKDLGTIAALADCWFLTHEIPRFKATRKEAHLRYFQSFWSAAEGTVSAAIAGYVEFVGEGV